MKIKNLFYMMFLLIAILSASLHVWTFDHSKEQSMQVNPTETSDKVDSFLENDMNLMPNAVWIPEQKHRTANLSYKVKGVRYYPKGDFMEPEEGIASWYGPKFHGRLTSSGEPYNMYEMTAAHKTLPIPSYVKVTNLKNGKEVVVRVNDRGPFHKNRIIDLSYSAAKKLGFLARGTARVRIEQIVSGPNEVAQNDGNLINASTVLSTNNFNVAQKYMEKMSNDVNKTNTQQDIYLVKDKNSYQVKVLVANNIQKKDTNEAVASLNKIDYVAQN